MAYCCVPLCKSNSKKKLGISFHEFPGNETYRQAWLKAISRKDFVPNENSNTSLVCSLHFVDSDFSSSTIKRRRLKPDAVPSVFSEYPRYMQPIPPKKRRKLERQFSVTHQKTPTSTTAPKEGREENATEDFRSEDICASLVSTSILASHPSTPTRPCPDDSDATQEAAVSVESAVQTHSLTPRKRSDVMAINRMRSQTFRLNKNIRKLREENERLRKKLAKFENNAVHSAVRKCLQRVGSSTFCLEDCLIEQILNAGRQRPVWSPDFVRECVVLYYLSPKAYRYIRTRGIIKLPSKNTLLRYVGKSCSDSGVTPLMKERLKAEVNELSEEARLCSLVVDEMAISSKYLYDRKMDCFFGQQTER